jgi:translation initiation factor IF-2
VKVQGDISVGELAKQAGLKAPAIQGKLMALGIMVSVNQRIDFATVERIAAEMGFNATDVGFKEAAFLDVAAPEEVEVSENEQTRPPIVTVMGHVDHGKTSLLDAIRQTKVTDGEAGGITQHVGAYQVEASGHRLTFIDTPGHAAFTQMRARGAAVTDLVVLVIAATEGPMPQTVEAIEHAQAAGCPIVVAVNKCDLPDADPEKAKQRLTEHNLVPEDFGGDVACVNVSAKTGDGIEQLLEMLVLQAEILELKADPARRASGSVLEARLDKGRGAVATLLVQDGTLKKGDTVVVGTDWGRVRQMQNDLGKNVKEADPSTPVSITGLSGVPKAGASFHVVENDRVAKQIVDHREDQERGKAAGPKLKLTLDEFYAQAGEEGPKELTVVLKSDVQGTCEAARDSLEKLTTDEVTLRVLSSGVGAITPNDVNLASASGTIILGYNVRPDPDARRQADTDGVEIRTYSIIMEMLDDVKAAMAGLLPPVVTENMLGRAEILETFTIPKLGTIAGSRVLEGKVIRHSHCRLVRDGKIMYTGTVGSLRRFKDNVKEVINGMECGIGVATYNDVKVGDIIEAYELNERPATL